MISIIIPLYNKEKYIKETLVSLREISDIEILVIDNNSTDNGLQICIEESKINSSIRILHQDVPGVSPTRNMGICEARGEYACFLDADDLFENFDRLQPIVKLDSPDILVFGFRKFDDHSETIISEHYMRGENPKVPETHLGEWLYESVENFVAYNVSTKLYRTEFLKENGLQFDEAIDRLEDLSFFVHAVGKAKSIIYTDAAVHLYRANIETGSLVHRKRDNFNYILKATHIFRKMEHAWKETISVEQMAMMERGLYTMITRELSTMRLQASINKNRQLNQQLKSFLDSTTMADVDVVNTTAYQKYRLATKWLVPLWIYTRLRWRK